MIHLELEQWLLNLCQQIPHMQICKGTICNLMKLKQDIKYKNE